MVSVFDDVDVGWYRPAQNGQQNTGVMVQYRKSRKSESPSFTTCSNRRKNEAKLEAEINCNEVFRLVIQRPLFSSVDRDELRYIYCFCMCSACCVETPPTHTHIIVRDDPIVTSIWMSSTWNQNQCGACNFDN